MSIKNTIKNEERYFNSFINQANDWSFFLGLLDYIRFLKEADQTKIIVTSLEGEENDANKILEDISARATTELDQCYNFLLDIINRKALSAPELTEPINEYSGLREGKIRSSQPVVSGLYDNLCEIMQFLVQSGHVDEIKDLVELEKDQDGKCYSKDFTFSQNSSNYRKALNIFNKRKETDLWGDWSYLMIFYDIALNGEDQLEALKSNDDILGMFGLSHLQNEIEKMKEGNLVYNPDYPPFFDKVAYSRRASRIHNFLQKELGQIEETTIKSGNSKSSFQFDPAGIVSGTLYIVNHRIIFTKIPAYIIDFFYKIRQTKVNEYQTYKNFNEFLREKDESLGSDDFSKRIILINKKVRKETDGFVKQLIEKENREKNGRLVANKYRLNPDI